MGVWSDCFENMYILPVHQFRQFPPFTIPNSESYLHMNYSLVRTVNLRYGGCKAEIMLLAGHLMAVATAAMFLRMLALVSPSHADGGRT